MFIKLILCLSNSRWYYLFIEMLLDSHDILFVKIVKFLLLDF